jgi:hypothetical protein
MFGGKFQYFTGEAFEAVRQRSLRDGLPVFLRRLPNLCGQPVPAGINSDECWSFVFAGSAGAVAWQNLSCAVSN